MDGKELTNIFKENISGLGEEPKFQWSRDQIKYAVDEKGEPAVKLAVGNVPLDYDLWKGLRNPAVVGFYPAGLREIWEFYSNRKKKRVDEFGRQTIFQIPRSFDFALKNYSRAVIISVMLPFSPKIIEGYTQVALENSSGSSHLYARMYEDVNLMIDKATTRVAIDLVSSDNEVLAMNNDNVKNVSKEAIPLTHQGDSHGPSKGSNYPQKSIAVLLGLGQFGIQRIVFRDELIKGKVHRFIGPLRSIIIFDKEDLVRDGNNEVIHVSENWRKFLFNLYDFTNIEPEFNKYRFCTYIPYDDNGCGKCIDCCPSGAQPNSTPKPNGKFSESVAKQRHRFYNGKLQFDFGKCCEDRGQMGALLPEWSCSRCALICASKGNRRSYAAESFYKKMLELTSSS